jgi:hypothetical protein
MEFANIVLHHFKWSMESVPSQIAVKFNLKIHQHLHRVDQHTLANHVSTLLILIATDNAPSTIVLNMDKIYV